MSVSFAMQINYDIVSNDRISLCGANTAQNRTKQSIDSPNNPDTTMLL